MKVAAGASCWVVTFWSVDSVALHECGGRAGPLFTSLALHSEPQRLPHEIFARCGSAIFAGAPAHPTPRLAR